MPAWVIQTLVKDIELLCALKLRVMSSGERKKPDNGYFQGLPLESS